MGSQTEEFYCKNDCTYTIIHVPNQGLKSNGQNSRDYTFIFKLREKYNTAIKLKRGIPFLCSGKLLTQYGYVTIHVVQNKIYSLIFHPIATDAYTSIL